MEFIRTFNIIVKFFCYYKKIQIGNDIIDYACNMGTYGKSILSRRLCVFFCSGLIQVFYYLKKEINENNNSELFNRIMILSSDIDISIRIEIAFNLRFICQELDGNFIKRNLLKTIENYLNEDNFIVKAEALISVIRNFKKFHDESNSNFINFFMQKLTNFFEMNNNYNLSYEVFLTIINEYFDSLKDYINCILMYLNNPVSKSIGINLLNLDVTKYSFFNTIKIFLKVSLFKPKEFKIK